MEITYYRKIAELILRDEQNEALQKAAERIKALPYEGKAKIAKSDRRALKAWMYAWCDEMGRRYEKQKDR
jgi:hypothetical protein